jgi:Phytanoyl-CoA dioxygenase (PhyH)
MEYNVAERSDFRLSNEDLQRFQESGIVGPFRLLADYEVKSVLKKLSIAKAKLFLWHRLLSRSVFLTKVLIHARWGKARWQKGLHLVSPVTYALSTTSVILDKIESILGPNLIQWGSDFITQKPGRLHRWHVDAECLECDGITVWLALDNLNDMTAMKVVSGSHRLPVHPVQLSSLYGLNTSDDDAVLKSARELDSRCEVKALEVKAGEFYIFYGRLWHSIRNHSPRPRSAITFQYSPTTATVKMPAGDYEFPFKWDSRPVPCCLVRGIDEYGRNLLIDPRYPLAAQKGG